MNKRAGLKAESIDLIDIDQLIADYYDKTPDVNNPAEKVSFGTSGHRGCSFNSTFNQTHILAIAQAICEYRKAHKITGPCFIGKDTHALSLSALQTVLEVFAANQVNTIIAENWANTPTPVISRAIIVYNQNHSQLSDGIVITPSHNPPKDGGIKYNTIQGAPAETEATQWIENRANQIIENNMADVKKVTLDNALNSSYVHTQRFEDDYVNDLINVIDMVSISQSGLHLAADPMGGAGVSYWQEIAECYRLNLTIVNDQIDSSFKFMHLDHDEIIRMDCSSAYAMTGLLTLKDKFDLAFGNDTDFDRHGIVTPSGLMNPNAFLVACVHYLFTHRPNWQNSISIGKTLVTSSMIDRVARSLNRSFLEFPVGFKWYDNGLFNGDIGFAGEESAGATFLRKNGSVWTTDKDGIIPCLLAAEMLSTTGKNPQQYYDELSRELGTSHYGRHQATATYQQKQALSNLSEDKLQSTMLAGDPIIDKITKAPANQASIGGLKVATQNGWFAARPSGTEDAYKIYAESFISQAHLEQIQKEAQNLVSSVI